jgi:hypothetical protein
MNKHTPPPPPSFEAPSNNPLGDLTEQDYEWLERLEREGRLAVPDREQLHAEFRAEHERFMERLRRAEDRLRPKDNPKKD